MSEIARGISAKCWTDPETENRVMDFQLCEAFAKRIDALLDLAESGWGVIANVDRGVWKQNQEWTDAAKKFRDKWHKTLGI